MAKVALYNVSGQSIGEIELNDNVFGIDVNEHAVYEAVKSLLANKRQGTQSAKSRGEVRGGRKPWRQKGTGRARQGSTRSPNWVGGGIVFAPKPRDYSYRINRKVRQLAMKSALTSKVQDAELKVLDALTFEAPKTKEMLAVLKNLNVGKKTLIVLAEVDDAVIKSANNLPNVETTLVTTLNVYDILNNDSFIMTEAAVRKVEEVYA